MSHSKFEELYFPLLKLPFPIIERTIRKLSASDVFHFSLISSEHLECVKSTTGHALSGAGIELEAKTPHEMKIKFTPVNADVPKFVISLENMTRGALSKNRKKEAYPQDINGVPMKIRFYANRITAYAPPGFESKIALLNYCFDNLQCQGISYYFNIPNHRISAFRPITDVFKQCEVLCIYCNTTMQSKDDVERFLSGITISKKFYLNLRGLVQPLNLPFSVFKAKSVHISNMFIITKETLLSLNCESVCFGRTNLTTEDLSEFVTNWFKSNGKQLKRLTVITETFIEPLNLSSIPEQNFERMGNYKTKIVREDGTFAVVYLTPPRVFDFRVSDEEEGFY